MHNQRKFWKPERRNALCWSIFCINDNKLVNLEQQQGVLRCLLCDNAHVNVSNPRKLAGKGLMSYYKTNGIMSPKNHVDVDHYLISKKIEKEVQNMT